MSYEAEIREWACVVLCSGRQMIEEADAALSHLRQVRKILGNISSSQRLTSILCDGAL